MLKRNWRELVSLVGAGLIVVGLVTWSLLSPIHSRKAPLAEGTVSGGDLVTERFRAPNEDALLGDRLAPGIEALVGVAALLVSIWAVWLVRGTLIEARQATAVANKAAEAAVKANDGFAEFSQRELRAYLKAEMVRWVVAAGEPLSVEVRFHNYGKTPAYDVIYICPIALTPGPYEWEVDPIDGAEGHRPSQVVHPGDEFFTNVTVRDEHGAEVRLTSLQFSRVLSGEWCVYVQCFVRYRDAFEKIRETDMRFEFSGEHCVRRNEFRKAVSGDRAT